MQQYLAAQQLEWHLGDPFDAGCTFSFPRIVELDEAEEFPADLVAEVRDWGFGNYLVPESYGGQLNSFEQLFALVRAISRRDLTVAIAYGATMLGALPVWLKGSKRQKEVLAESICGGNFGAIGLTEEAHGSDLLSNECIAVRSGAGFSMTGEKWLINNGTQGRWMTVLARTSRAGGPFGFSFLHARKSELDPAYYEHLPKIHTLGIRGADMSGMRFHGCPLPADSLVGELGEGIDCVLKTLQISRTFFTAFSLGAADTALRIALRFALDRRLYGDSVFSIPVARDQLVGVFLDILTADCMSYSACRAIQVCPRQMSLWSAVVKYFVPTLSEEAVYQAALAFGARYYLRQHYACGVFQKIFRDNILIGLFDGSTAVNQFVIASQLHELAERRAGDRPADEAERMERLWSLFDWNEPVPELDTSGLTLGNAGRDDIVGGLTTAAASWRGWTSGLPVSPRVVEDVAACLDLLLAELRRLTEALEALRAQGTFLPKSTAAFRLARAHCLLHSASSCVYAWVTNQHHADEFFASGEWLVLCLERIVGRLGNGPCEISDEYRQPVAAEMLRRLEENTLFSVLPLALAENPQPKMS